MANSLETAERSIRALLFHDRSFLGSLKRSTLTNKLSTELHTFLIRNLRDAFPEENRSVASGSKASSKALAAIREMANTLSVFLPKIDPFSSESKRSDQPLKTVDEQLGFLGVLFADTEGGKAAISNLVKTKNWPTVRSAILAALEQGKADQGARGITERLQAVSHLEQAMKLADVRWLR